MRLPHTRGQYDALTLRDHHTTRLFERNGEQLRLAYAQLGRDLHHDIAGLFGNVEYAAVHRVALVAFGVVTISIAQFLYFDSLSRIDAGRASVATAVEPVVAALLATVLVSQGLAPLGWLGIALVVIGVAGSGIEEPAEGA